jgi:hypothetical protein
MFKKIVLIFLLLNSLAAIGSDEKNILQDAKTIKRYEDAGICFGSYEGALAKGVAASSLSEIARNNLIKLTKDYAIVDKYKDSRKKCHSESKSMEQAKSCLENSIPNKSIAAFWVGYVQSVEFIYRKNKVDAEVMSNSVCLTVK